MNVGPPPKEAEVERVEGLSGVSGDGERVRGGRGGCPLYILR
jgi:hypothetical protein